MGKLIVKYSWNGREAWVTASEAGGWLVYGNQFDEAIPCEKYDQALQLCLDLVSPPKP